MSTASADVRSGLLIIDKPQGITSHDVVSRVRRLAHTRRVGHAGTLDPMATGVLVIGINKATRLLTWITDHTKRYEARVRLGVETTTEDAEGDLSAARGCTTFNLSEFENVLGGFRGQISQVPSAVSAIKVDGKRAYARVRAGEEVVLKPRQVEISALDVAGEAYCHEASYFVDGQERLVPCVDIDISVECSAGTYIRALARDIGNALGCGAHLIALRRTRVGEFEIRNAHNLEFLIEAAEQTNGNAELPITSLSEAARAMFPTVQLSDIEAAAFAHGQAPRRSKDEMKEFCAAVSATVTQELSGPFAALGDDGKVLGLLKISDSRFKTILVF